MEIKTFILAPMQLPLPSVVVFQLVWDLGKSSLDTVCKKYVPFARMPLPLFHISLILFQTEYLFSITKPIL